MKYNEEDSYVLKDFVGRLFGNSAWLEIKHATDVKTWKKYASKILSVIEFSKENTVMVADEQWFEVWGKIIAEGKDDLKSLTTVEQIFSSLATILAKISFLQLGKIPDNYRSKKVSMRDKSIWRLDEYRSVQYVQDNDQKANSNKKNQKNVDKSQ